MRYKTHRTHIMENLYILFALQLGIFTFFIGTIIRLLIHLLISNENETK
jgi:hypothetical protein